MTETLLDKISISEVIITDKWANGTLGKIIDIWNDGNFRFVDYRKGEDGLVRKCHIGEAGEISCPIVAKGIIGYWLHNRNRSFTELFKDYYELKMAEYVEGCQHDIDLCDRDNEKYFITKGHIPAERKDIKASEAIFEYLTGKDVKTIKVIADKYLSYARKRRNDYHASQYPKNEVIERRFLSHYEQDGAAYECVDWLRTEFNLPVMGPHWLSEVKTEKEKLVGGLITLHEVDIPIKVREDLEDFDEQIMRPNGGLMEEIEENLKSYSSQTDRVRYITNLVTPFRDFALPFYPYSQIAERQRAVKYFENNIKHWEGVSEDEVDKQTGEPLNPKSQIEACKEYIVQYEKDIEYWDIVQSRFFGFSQPGTCGLYPEEKIDMCNHLMRWSIYMNRFACCLASLALTYGIDLMDIQNTCGVYIVGRLLITDYVDEHYIKDYQHAQKLLEEIKKPNGMSSELSAPKGSECPEKVELRTSAEDTTDVSATTNTVSEEKSDNCDLYGFNRDKIKSLITADEKDIIADILIENMGIYSGKNKPKSALLPFYCAVYEINWIAQRPEYKDFVDAFPGLVKNNTSYKDYVPTKKDNSNYNKDFCKGIDIESMSEALQASLNERIKQK